jgi:hypothetical protein
VAETIFPPQLVGRVLNLKVVALKPGFVVEEEFDRVVDAAKMVKP